MANQKQLEILKKGVKIWNRWRKKNDEKIDLSEAYLPNVNLSDANLSKANLSNIILINASLSEANLSEANLSEADLSDTDLSDAVLSDTNLTNASLVRTDLHNANLSEANLSKANLINADLSYANLSKANLSEANLSKTDLSYANLYKANLSKANLAKTSLIGTSLINADLSGADLSFANITTANLEEVNLQNCAIGITNFGLTNLGTVKGLNSVKVSYECSIDFQTLRDSKNIPKEFLLKIGLPENYVNYLPDFYDPSPLRLFPVFLSHSWANKEFAGRLYEALIKKGVLVWYDEKKLRAGDKIFEGLTKAIDVYDKMILVCSKESLEESWWVDEEMNRIFKKERTYLKEKNKNVSLLIPITIDDHIFKWEGAKGESIRGKVIGDFTEWKDDVKFEKALNQLIEALNVDRGEENITSFL